MSDFVVNGLQESRLKLERSALERSYVEQWKEEHAHYDFLALILGQEPDKITERDRIVAATVIQWLGSMVGNHFIETAMDRFLETAMNKENAG